MFNSLVVRGTPSLAKGILARRGPALFSASQAFHFEVLAETRSERQYSFAKRAFSSFDAGAVVKDSPGYVTKKLRALNMKTVKEVMQELKTVDENSDER